MFCILRGIVPANNSSIFSFGKMSCGSELSLPGPITREAAAGHDVPLSGGQVSPSWECLWMLASQMEMSGACVEWFWPCALHL